MEEELSELDADPLAEDFDLKENSLLLRKKKNRNTATTSDSGNVVRIVDNAIHWINAYPVNAVIQSWRSDRSQINRTCGPLGSSLIKIKNGG